MKFSRLLTAAGAALVLAALAGSPALADEHSPSGAVFVQTDNPAGNAVVVYDRGADGRLHRAGDYPTGGLGGVLDGSVVDHLDHRGTLSKIAEAQTGQAATCWIVNVRGRLYLSNAGSGTVSVFDGTLAPIGLTPTRAGTVDAVASPDGRFLYVQTGAAGGVDAFRVAPDGTLTAVESVTVPGATGGEGIAAS